MRLKFMRATVLLVLALTMITTFGPASASAATYAVVVNGVAVPGQMAELRQGQLAVAVRPFVEAMGGQVTWSAASQQVGISYKGSQIAMWLGTTTVFQDGARLWAPVAPYLKNGSTMVPAWWLAVRMGANVSYSGTTLTVKTGSPASTGGHPLKDPSFFFPFPLGTKYQPFYEGWGDPRYFDGVTSRHEGTDILADKGTPVVAVAAGTVVRYGWNTLGGYRLTVQLDKYPGYRFYYAHFDRYAAGIYLGAHVRAGQVIGYVGNTGEGPERTEGKFVTHLHFGIYNSDGTAIDPYPFLKYWEPNRTYPR
jgi:hypothetical protein